MRVITVARKPLSEPSVAANVLKHGTGAINVDTCRVGLSPAESTEEALGKLQGRSGVGQGGDKFGGTTYGENLPDRVGWDIQSGGRWPANLILQHQPGCIYNAEDGTKECEPSCPVSDLDDQSGILTSGARINRVGEGGQFGTAIYGDSTGRKNTSTFSGSQGGASRFYKQVGGKEREDV